MLNLVYAELTQGATLARKAEIDMALAPPVEKAADSRAIDEMNRRSMAALGSRGMIRPPGRVRPKKKPGGEQ